MTGGLQTVQMADADQRPSHRTAIVDLESKFFSGHRPGHRHGEAHNDTTLLLETSSVRQREICQDSSTSSINRA